MQKEIMELSECTFQPEINMKSEEMLSMNRISVFERKLPRLEKKEPVLLEESQFSEMEITPKIHPIKKHDKNFYKKQLEWEQKRKEKIKQMKISKDIKEFTSLREAPYINKNKNNKYFRSNQDFLARMEMKKKKSHLLKKKLEKKYNSFAFAPSINHNIKAESIVIQRLQDDYQEDDSDY